MFDMCGLFTNSFANDLKNQSEFRIIDESEDKQPVDRNTGFHHDVTVCVQRETKSQQGVHVHNTTEAT